MRFVTFLVLTFFSEIGAGVSVDDSAEGGIHTHQTFPLSKDIDDVYYTVKSSTAVLPFLEKLLQNIQQRFIFSHKTLPRNTVFDNDVTLLEQTNGIDKRHHFVRTRRPMADCLSNCIRRVQRVIACKNLCF